MLSCAVKVDEDWTIRSEAKSSLFFCNLSIILAFRVWAHSRACGWRKKRKGRNLERVKFSVLSVSELNEMNLWVAVWEYKKKIFLNPQQARNRKKHLQVNRKQNYLFNKCDKIKKSICTNLPCVYNWKHLYKSTEILEETELIFIHTKQSATHYVVPRVRN